MKILLRIDSWIGVSPGAIHYYGRLRAHEYSGKGYIDLVHQWSHASAKKANKQHRWNYPGDDEKSPYKAGRKTKCFDSEGEVIKFAIENYIEIFPGATSLEIDTSSVDDRMILDSQSEGA